MEDELKNIVVSSRFLVVGGAGSIGQNVVYEIFKRNPKVLHVVDISENNLAELVREIRSSLAYGSGEFATFAIDSNSPEFKALFGSQNSYDYVLNLSALKHVRSEADPFTLMRMTDVNIFNALKILDLCKTHQVKNYFCVSSDKASNPVNLMGASKRIMEMFLAKEKSSINVTKARFANVAFSDGSLLHGFQRRVLKSQPITAPTDILRYFITPKEAGELCLITSIFGKSDQIYIPKLTDELKLISFEEIARRFIQQLGFDTFECSSEDEARGRCTELIQQKKWPCYFFKSDTTGEKPFEEFHTSAENVTPSNFDSINIINEKLHVEHEVLDYFKEEIKRLRESRAWSKHDILKLYKTVLVDFNHLDTGKYLNQRM